MEQPAGVSAASGNHGRRDSNRPDNASEDRALRRPDRRRRYLRGRRRLSPHEAVPRHGFVVLESQETFGGTWSPTAIRASAPTATCIPSAIASSPGRPRRSPPPPRSSATWARSSTRTSSPAHPLSAPDRFGELVEPGQSLDHRGDADRYRRDGRVSPRTSCGCARATTGTRRATCRTGMGWRPSRARLVHPQNWPEDLDYEGKKVVVIGSGATAATLIPAIAEDCGARHDAAALADLLHGRPQCQRARRDAARSCRIDETWIHEIVRRKILYDQAAFTRRAFEEPDAVRKELIGGFATISAPTTTWRRTSPRATGPGGSASPSCRTGPVQGDRSAARRRWSPTRSSASPRPASC